MESRIREEEEVLERENERERERDGRRGEIEIRSISFINHYCSGLVEF